MSAKPAKVYSFNNLAGCVVQCKSRQTGFVVGLYHSNQAGIESDPDLPWTTMCEEHGLFVCYSSFALAESHLADPAGWCEACAQHQPGGLTEEKAFKMLTAHRLSTLPKESQDRIWSTAEGT